MHKKISKLSILLILVSAIFNSCKNDLEVTAEWKEKMIVYGLLNRSDSVHYLKINKAFLGKGNAITMAQVPDSTSYGNELQATIEKWSNNTYVESYALSRDTSVQKNTGAFAYPKQVLYRLDKKLDQKSEYRLKAVNTKSGVSVSAKTKLVRDFSFRWPTPLVSVVDFTYANMPVEVTWVSAEYGRLHQLVIRFNYTEKDTVSGALTPHFVDWVFLTNKTTGLEGGREIKESFMGELFFKFLKGKLSVNKQIQRYAGKLDFMISVAADDFTTYMEVSKPSTGVVQEKGQFTNVENGLGIFSSRYVKTATVSLNSSSLDELIGGEHTSELGFKL